MHEGGGGLSMTIIFTISLTNSYWYLLVVFKIKKMCSLLEYQGGLPSQNSLLLLNYMKDSILEIWGLVCETARLTS
jgi:hypothetical protein